MTSTGWHSWKMPAMGLSLVKSAALITAPS
jgi:hypothetical protein